MGLFGEEVFFSCCFVDSFSWFFVGVSGFGVFSGEVLDYVSR